MSHTHPGWVIWWKEIHNSGFALEQKLYWKKIRGHLHSLDRFSAWVKSVRNGCALRLDDLALGIGQSVVPRSADGFLLPESGGGSLGERESGFLAPLETDFSPSTRLLINGCNTSHNSYHLYSEARREVDKDIWIHTSLKLFIPCEGNVLSCSFRHPTPKRSQMYPQIDVFPEPGYLTPAFFKIRGSNQCFTDVCGFYIMFYLRGGADWCQGSLPISCLASDVST